MRKHTTLLTLIPAALVISACGREAARPDDALRNDLTLASQATVPAQYMSPGEMGYANSPYSPYGTTPYAGQPYPAAQRLPAPAPRPTASVRRTSSSGASRPSSSGTIYRAPAPAPEPQIIKHTKRDAAIGAAAGAIIGAATSRDKVKGGLIGAAIGGVLGGVIGNNVDVQRKY
jgi:hypothetical protein